MIYSDPLLVPDTAKRILAVSIGGLGDTVLFSPVMRALKSRYPESRIELLLASQLAEMAFGQANEIDSVKMVDMNHSFLPFRIAGLMRFAFRSRIHGGFDIGAFASGLNPKLSNFLKLTAGIRNIVCAPNPPACASDLSCNIALARHFDDNISEGDVFIPSTEESWLEANEALKKHGISWDDEKIIAVYPSTEHDHRPRWYISRLTQVIKLLKRNRFEGKIVVIGSTAEGEEWGKIDTDKQADANLAGELSILGIASLFTKCSLAIGNDGGLMHMAGTMGCPVVVVMTNTPLSYRPPGEKVRVIHSKLTCCNSVYPRRPKSCKVAQCKDDIMVEEVYRACIHLLSETL